MASESGTQQYLEIQRVYLKDVSFEAPGSPQMFAQEWKPNTELQLSSSFTRLGEDIHEVALNVTVTTKVGDKTAYLAEVKQAGVFGIKGFEEAQMGQLLGSYCPNVLFPFAREAVAELIVKGGYPQLLLAPINFDALYAQQQQRQHTKTTDGGAKQ